MSFRRTEIVILLQKEKEEKVVDCKSGPFFRLMPALKIN